MDEQTYCKQCGSEIDPDCCWCGNLIEGHHWSDGGVYFKNGFELIRVNKPGYYYVDKNYLIRHNRMKFQKKLIGAYDCTEYEKAREMGFNKIFDCGSLSFGVN